MLKVIQTIHQMNGLQWQGLSIKECHKIRNAMLDNNINSKVYKLRCPSGAFLQGYDESNGWILIEFWLSDFQPFVDYLDSLFLEPDFIQNGAYHEQNCES